MGQGKLTKRSVTLKGHRTSIALEPEFWAALDDLARAENVSLAQLVFRVDVARTGGLASALRTHALAAARAGRLSA